MWHAGDPRGLSCCLAHMPHLYAATGKYRCCPWSWYVCTMCVNPIGIMGAAPLDSEHAACCPDMQLGVCRFAA